MPAIWIAILVFVAVIAAEALHTRRVDQIRALVFPTSKVDWRFWLWIGLLGFGVVRAVALAAMTWGWLALLAAAPAEITARDAVEDTTDPARLRRIVLLLDVSPSMAIRDSAGRFSTRAGRAADVAIRALSFVDLKQSRVSIVAFYTSAKPVIIDTVDPNVVRNVLDGLPLTDAFADGKTDLFAGLRGAFDLAASWDTKTADLIVLSDGDSVPGQGMPAKPRSIDRVFIAGVGDPRTGTSIDGHLSRQDASNLKQTATRLGGEYVDINAADLPAGVFGGMGGVLPSTSGPTVWDLRRLALAALTAGAALLLLLPVTMAGLDRLLPSTQSGKKKGGGACVIG